MRRLITVLALFLLVLAPALGHREFASARATPVATSTDPVRWLTYDVTLDVQLDGRVVVTERQVVAFQSGSYRTAFATIPLDEVDGLGNVGVAEEVDGVVQPYQPVASDAFDQNIPNTYRAIRESDEVQVEWSFPRTEGSTRIFVLSYTVLGAIRVDLTDPTAYQQFWWAALATDVSMVAPIDQATATVRLPQAVPVELTSAHQYDSPELPGRGDMPDSISSDGQSWTFRASDLRDGEGLYVLLEFPPIVNAPVPVWQLSR